MVEVVVGVDGSADAVAALSWAADYAEAMHLPLHVVTAVEPGVLSALWTARPEENTEEAAVEAARTGAGDLLNTVRLARGRDLGVPVTVDAVVGRPTHVLARTARGAAVLVVGTRGAGLVGRAVLGSVSSGVVNAAPCPVVVVPAEQRPRAAAAG